MLFNSIDFFVFLSLVFIGYWFVTYKSLKMQNVLLLLASYVFYGWWDWRFLSLIALSTIIDYTAGSRIYESKEVLVKKRWLWVSIVFNLGMLGFF